MAQKVACGVHVDYDDSDGVYADIGSYIGAHPNTGGQDTVINGNSALASGSTGTRVYAPDIGAATDIMGSITSNQHTGTGTADDSLSGAQRRSHVDHAAGAPAPSGGRGRVVAAYKLPNYDALVIMRADITTIKVDAVVSAANERLQGGGGVDGAIHLAAGPRLLAACQELSPAAGRNPGVRCPAGKSRLTEGPFDPQLAATHVIHTVGPMKGAPRYYQVLKSAYASAISIAKRKGYGSISVPAISTGVYGISLDDSARAAVDALVLASDDSDKRLVIIFALVHPAAMDEWVAAAENAGLPAMAASDACVYESLVVSPPTQRHAVSVSVAGSEPRNPQTRELPAKAGDSHGILANNHHLSTAQSQPQQNARGSGHNDDVEGDHDGTGGDSRHARPRQAAVAHGHGRSWLTDHDYIGSQLKPNDAADFSAAGVLLHRKWHDGRAFGLFGQTSLFGHVTLLGGQREQVSWRSGRETAAQTAIREFDEETGKQLSKVALDTLRSACANMPAGVQVCWLGRRRLNPKYALFIVDIDSLNSPLVTGEVAKLPESFDSWRHGTFSWFRSIFAGPGTREMDALVWLPLADVAMHRVPRNMRLDGFVRNAVLTCPTMQQWMVSRSSNGNGGSTQQTYSGDSASDVSGESRSPPPSYLRFDFESSDGNESASTHSTLDKSGTPSSFSELAQAMMEVHPLSQATLQRQRALADGVRTARQLVKERERMACDSQRKLEQSHRELDRAQRKADLTAAEAEAAYRRVPALQAAADNARMLAERRHADVKRRIEQLSSSVQEARTEAEASLERCHYTAAATSTPLPDIVVPPPPTNIIPIDRSSPEWAKAAKHVNGHGSIQLVKKVDVAHRAAAYNAFRRMQLGPHADNVIVALHGTPKVDGANNIARAGPDPRLKGKHGQAYGAGFYCTTDCGTAISYAGGTGSVVVCMAALGNVYSSTNGAGSGQPCPAGYHSIQVPLGNGTGAHYVLPHPDQILPLYVIDFGNADEHLAKQEEARRRLAQAKFKRDRADKHRLYEHDHALSRIDSIGFFTSACDAFMCELDADTIDEREQLFKLESSQFQSGLQLYSKKRSILSCLTASPNPARVLILKGGTGIGKTILICQWLLDYVVGAEDGKVAVVVPRVQNAISGADFVSKLRGGEVGADVGYATGDDTRCAASARIVFFTPGMFRRAEFAKDNNLTDWSAVIVDEAHEQPQDTAALVPPLCRLAALRDDLRLVLMSATIDVQRESDRLASNGAPTACAVSCPGVNFPITEFWWQEHDDSGEAAWDPENNADLTTLCYNVHRIYNHMVADSDTDEGATCSPGNMLVFLPTIASVTVSCNIMQGLVSHLSSIVVLPYYAALSQYDKSKVIHFDKDPGNHGKCMIVFCTNIAEAGLTLPDITTVVDTGRENRREYDALTCCERSLESFISKAQHEQRKGRTGRTCPGRCYNLFSKEKYQNGSIFHPDPPPAVTLENLAPLYLGLVEAGYRPEQVSLVAVNNGADRAAAAERLVVAKQDLLMFGALTSKGPNDELSVTLMGKFLLRVPLQLELGMALVYSCDPRFTCSADVVVIVCVAQEAMQRPLLVPRVRNTDAPWEDYENLRGGDFEAFLTVYKDWLANNKSHQWCSDRGINHLVLVRSEKLLEKVLRSMQEFGLEAYLVPQPEVDRWSAVTGALAAGLCKNIAICNSEFALSFGFTLARPAGTTLQRVYLHNTCTISNSVQLVMYLQRQSGRYNCDYISIVGAVDRVTVLQAAEVRGEDVRAQIEAGLDALRRTSQSFDASMDTPFGSACCKTNFDALRNSHPDCAFAFDVSNNSMHVSAPESASSLVFSESQKCIDLARDAAAVKTEVIADIPKPALLALLPRTQSNAKRDACAAALAAMGGGSIPFVSIGLVDRDKGTMEVMAPDAVLPSYLAYFRTKLGMGKHFSGVNSLVAAPTAAGFGVSATGGGASAAISNAQQLSAASVIALVGASPKVKPPCPPSSMQTFAERLNAVMTWSETQVLSSFGRGHMGSMLLLARHVVQDASMGLYGGFIRDAIVRGNLYLDGATPTDIDISIPNASTDTKSAWASIVAWSRSNRMLVPPNVPANTNTNGCVTTGFLTTIDGSGTFKVQVADAARFQQSSSLVDFACNNLIIKQSSSHGGPLLQVKYPNQPKGASVQRLLQDIRDHIAREVQNPPQPYRRSIMTGKGWTILPFGTPFS